MPAPCRRGIRGGGSPALGFGPGLGICSPASLEGGFGGCGSHDTAVEAGKTAARRDGWAGMAAELAGALWLGEGMVKGQEAVGTADRRW